MASTLSNDSNEGLYDKEQETSGIPNEMIIEIKEVFDLLDTEGIGQIDVNSIKAAMENAGIDSSRPQMYEILSGLSEEFEGYCTFSELIDILAEQDHDYTKQSIEAPAPVQQTPVYEETSADIHNELLDARSVRKRTEEDARLLANRIALLKLEEQKAWKKIEETRKKTQEIMETRARNMEMQRKKEEEKKRKDEEMRTRAMYNRMMKEQQRSLKNDNMASINRKIKQEADLIKQSKQEHKKIIEEQKRKDLEEKARIRQTMVQNRRVMDAKKKNLKMTVRQKCDRKFRKDLMRRRKPGSKMKKKLHEWSRRKWS